ncbi:MAG: metallophosphoesterase [Spirochaetia bacterium]
MRKEESSFHNLQELYDEAVNFKLNRSSRYIILSDLHLGNGGRTDDFRENGEMVIRILKEYYFDRDYTLILNGDIEELQKFTLASIRKRWADFYELLDLYRNSERLVRIVGNHDLTLLTKPKEDLEARQALKLSYKDNSLFIFHGHQTSPSYIKYHRWIGFVLRYLANPLRIRNYSVSHDSLKKFKTEERAYNFAAARKILAVIGHTHRPLFESLSKEDTIRFKIEKYCRKYPEASEKNRTKIENLINRYKQELHIIARSKPERELKNSLYNSTLLVPCVFNSGCGIGKSGFTALEVKKETIGLVHWFDRNRSEKYLTYNNHDAKQLGDTDFYRVILKRDALQYIFSRIFLLS